MHLLFTILLAFFFITSPALAQRYEFDKAHTQILFFVNHLGFSNSQGEFLDYDGYFIFDKKQPENARVEIDIKTASIDMDNDKWNKHMMNDDFFDVENYPIMRFTSNTVVLGTNQNAEIHGDLTILDVTKPVTLNMQYNKCGKHPFSGNFVCGFSGSTIVKRSDFGMTYGLPLIGDEVTIRLEVEGYRDIPESQDMQ